MADVVDNSVAEKWKDEKFHEAIAFNNYYILISMRVIAVKWQEYRLDFNSLKSK